MPHAGGRVLASGLAVALALAALGCSSEPEAAGARGPSTRGVGARGAGAASEEGAPRARVLPGSAVAPGPAPPRGGDRPARRAPAAAGGGSVQVHDEGADADSALGRALAQAFGAPTDCLSEATRDRLEERLALRVSAQVLPSGRVGSAAVSGAGLGDEDVACLTARAERLRLPGPVEGAPRRVSTVVEYSVEDTRSSESERVGPGPRVYGPGTLDPDSTLPAAGTETERPAGSLAPDRTLPAQVEPGPAPGYVGPATTLPATAEQEAERRAAP